MVLILDCTVLINCIDKCLSVDLIDSLIAYPFELHIVETVNKEYLYGLNHYPKKANASRYHKHVPSHIKVIDESNFPFDNVAKLSNLHAGEFMSAIYKLKMPGEYIICTDDKAVHLTMQRQFSFKCLWTSDLLVLLYQHVPSFINNTEVVSLFEEMKNNGFIGFDSNKINLNSTYNFNNFF